MIVLTAGPASLARLMRRDGAARRLADVAAKRKTLPAMSGHGRTVSVGSAGAAACRDPVR